MSLLISVVICTYNRANWLAAALQSVCEQALDSSEYEVIVVDNNSTDNTRAVTESFALRFPNVRYLFEPQQGNSHARNVGWQEAKAKYIAFIDDDCKVPEQWLMKAKEIIENLSPGVFGGPYFAFHNTPKPRWFKESYESYVPSHEACVLEKPSHLVAGNFFARRNVLEKSGGFDPTWGIVGEKRAYGEETELLVRIHRLMPQEMMYYDPKLFVYHLVRPEKTTWRWIIRDRFDRGRYHYRAFQLPPPEQIRPLQLLLKIVIIVAVLALSPVVGALFRDRTKYPFIQNHLYESSCRYITSLGRAYEQYRHLASRKNAKGYK